MNETYNWEEKCRWALDAQSWAEMSQRWRVLEVEAEKRGWTWRAEASVRTARTAAAVAEMTTLAVPTAVVMVVELEAMEAAAAARAAAAT